MADQEVEYNITIISADGVETREMTTSEIDDHKAQVKVISDNKTAEETAQTEKDNLKASAKTKLMNGEALTEEEANEMLGL
tara:strand:+ start:5119 stop:5361 length:243 start_codon:yes stop_codon:yes gene_type:complete